MSSEESVADREPSDRRTTDETCDDEAVVCDPQDDMPTADAPSVASSENDANVATTAVDDVDVEPATQEAQLCPDPTEEIAIEEEDRNVEQDMTVREMREFLRERGVTSSGAKKVLEARMKAFRNADTQLPGGIDVVLVANDTDSG
jgi:hypothetical protein